MPALDIEEYIGKTFKRESEKFIIEQFFTHRLAGACEAPSAKTNFDEASSFSLQDFLGSHLATAIQDTPCFTKHTANPASWVREQKTLHGAIDSICRDNEGLSKIQRIKLLQHSILSIGECSSSDVEKCLPDEFVQFTLKRSVKLEQTGIMTRLLKEINLFDAIDNP